MLFFPPLTAEIEDLLASLNYCQKADDVEENGIVVTASLSAVGQVAECFQKGYILPETLEQLCNHTLVINERLLDTIKHVLVKKVKQHIQLKNQED